MLWSRKSWQVTKKKSGKSRFFSLHHRISTRGGWNCYPHRNAEHPLPATMLDNNIAINVIISTRVRRNCWRNHIYSIQYMRQVYYNLFRNKCQYFRMTNLPNICRTENKKKYYFFFFFCHIIIKYKYLYNLCDIF